MAHSTVAFPSYILFLALFVQIAIGDNLFEVCSTASGNFSSTSTYKKNLNKLLADLKSSTPETGFCLSSAGQKPDQVFGLAQCGAQVSTSDCRACILQANRDIFSLCGNTKAAMIWYDACFLRYADSEFAGIVDTGDGAVLPNLFKASNPDSFFPKMTALLSKLSNQASLSAKLFSSGQINVSKSQKIFGLVDCTRDLSSFDCKFCIDFLISLTRNETISISNRIGGRIVTATCNIRFETFKFLNA